MPWVRFTDEFPINRKVEGLSDAAFRLHVSAIFWCARNLTDGVVPEEDLDIVCARVRTPSRFIPELVKRGLWHEPGQACVSEDCPAPAPGGYVVHDYLEFQFSAAQVKAERKSNAERQRAYRERQRQALAERRSGNNGSSLPVSNAVTNVYPVPSRPEGTGTVNVDQSSSPRNARATDDEIDRLIISLLHKRTGQTITADHAARIRHDLLDGRKIRVSRRAYVAKSIEDEPDPTRFLPATGTTEDAPPSEDSRSARPPWCGTCDERTRLVDLPDGKVARCQQCHPNPPNPYRSAGE